MKKSRIKELFELLKQYLIKGDANFQYGLCKELERLSMYDASFTYYEYICIEQYLNKCKPTTTNEYKEFIDNEYWIDTEYWWKTIDQAPETKQIRIDFLTKLINELK